MTEKEILYTMLAEESAELIQTCTKIIRFGENSCHPQFPTYPNRQRFEAEVKDVLAVLELLGVDYKNFDLVPAIAKKVTYLNVALDLEERHAK